ncbi:hypothetical protein [Flavihumibacter petaseus]|uniref:Uncharacterized protein n=1 Tax=Flavihumibacter petaseus NBRC 106054 TaxID=1220578 RepID=A0A0E9N206_9BACT|nr:hypothetical protein [Flavihumibacter petaseus]GAO44042.1 hypothetical protein FPE01S_03_00820 [Flavihumibacter petaseus NBRC 106054]
MKKLLPPLLALALLAAGNRPAGDELPEDGTIETPVGKLSFESGYPTSESVQKLYDDLDFQRADRSILWQILDADQF